MFQEEHVAAAVILCKNIFWGEEGLLAKRLRMTGCCTKAIALVRSADCTLAFATAAKLFKGLPPLREAYIQVEHRFPK